MQSANDLKQLLFNINHKSYPAYKSARGAYQFPNYILSIDHVQGDPFAAPSRVSIHVTGKTAAFPPSLYDTYEKRIALQDYLLRQFARAIAPYSFRAKGSGKSGLLGVSRCGQEILERIQEASPYFVSMNADMIFNFPAQTEDTLIHDIEMVVASGASQTTFYPLMASPSVQRSLAATVGKVDYNRERRFYEIICDLLLGDLPGGQPGLFELGSAWTFNRRGTGAAGEDAMIDEYVVDYEEYPAIGSGGITYLGENLYVNTFSVREYNTAIEAGHMSMMGKTTFSLRDRMRYRFMMQLFGLRLDKRQFKKDFGVSVERGLPVEMGFMRACGAFATDNADELTLTPKGRYLVVVMMRQFFIGVNNLRDQARAALTGEERELIFGDGKRC